MQEMGHSQVQSNPMQHSKDATAISTDNMCTPTSALPTVKCNQCRADVAETTFPKVNTSPISGQEVGEKAIDFFKELVQNRSCQNVANRILSYLAPRDLCSICCVSRVWRKACMLDYTANAKRIQEIEFLRKRLFKMKEENELQWKNEMTFLPSYARGPLGNIGNLVNAQSCVHEPSIPSRYQLFREEAKKLLPCESLQPCPRCTSPSRVDPYLKRGLCSREGCAYNFCTRCCCQYHDLDPCPILSKPRLPQRDLIGSKASRRNLKRL